MNFTTASIPTELHWLALVVCAVFLLHQGLRCRWRELLLTPRLNLCLAVIVMLTFLWSMTGKLTSGLNLHLVGATVAVLMFGLPRACVVLTLCAVLTLFNAQGINGNWRALPINLLVTGFIPACIAAGVLRVAERRLPAHFFIFIFIDACFAAALGLLCAGVVATLLMALGGTHPLSWLLQNYLPFFLLLAFAEAWLTGMVITLMVVYKPEWVSLFDDRRYLLNK